MARIGNYEITGRRVAAAAGTGLAFGALAANMACSGPTKTVVEKVPAAATGPATAGGEASGGDSAKASSAGRDGLPSTGTEAPGAPTSEESPYQQALAAREFVLAQCATLVSDKVATHFYDPKFKDPNNTHIYYGFDVADPKNADGAPVNANGVRDEAKCVANEGATDVYVNNSSTQSAEWTLQGEAMIVTVQDGPHSGTAYAITANTKPKTPAAAAETQAFAIAEGGVLGNDPSAPSDMPESYVRPPVANPFVPPYIFPQ